MLMMKKMSLTKNIFMLVLVEARNRGFWTGQDAHEMRNFRGI
jgi:hypothetical protein